MEVWQTSNLRRLRLGEEKKKEEERRTNHSMKIYMVSLFHRATINKPSNLWSPYVIGQTIYIFMLWFVLLLSSSFFFSIIAQLWASGRQPNFAALNRGRHLYSAGRPSGWALAHISSCDLFRLLGLRLINSPT